MKFDTTDHQRESIRLKGYDYSKAGLYFITICCQDKVYRFGEIINKKMVHNDVGKIAIKCWLEIPVHFPSVVLHEYVVMPNHVHGIIEITRNALPQSNVGVENFQPLPLDTRKNEFQKIISRSIGSIIKGFKIGVTKWFHSQTQLDFLPQEQLWQRNYFEHIIRDRQDYLNTVDYIKENPAKWEEDKYYHKK